MKRKTKMGWLIRNLLTGKELGKNENSLFETSSTIKAPLVYLALQKVIHNSISLETMLSVEKRHLSTGSGIVNWTDWRKLTVRDALRYTVKYSDCVTSNMLIDFIGGKRRVNLQLKKLSSTTKLIKPMITFGEREYKMPKVGQTTPREMLELFLLLRNSSWPLELSQFIKEIFNDIYASWFDAHVPSMLKKNLLHKTGSMINIGRVGDTVFNVVGIIEIRHIPFAFSFYTRTKFESKPDEAQIEYLQAELVQHLLAQLNRIASIERP